MATKPVLALLAVLFLAAALTAQTPAPAATQAPAVMRWAPSAGTVVVGKDEMKVLTNGNLKIAVTMVDLWKETTAARLQITNLGADTIAIAPEAFTLDVVKPKPQTVNAVPAEKLSKDIRKHADGEAEMAGQQAMHYATANGAGEKDEAAHIRMEGQQKADYIKDSAFTPSLQPRYQAIGHMYFPYLKKRDEVLLRLTIAGTTYEFPFEKAEIKPGVQPAQ